MSRKPKWLKLMPRLEELAKRGYTRSEIANTLGVTYEALRTQLKRLKLTGKEIKIRNAYQNRTELKLIQCPTPTNLKEPRSLKHPQGYTSIDEMLDQYESVKDFHARHNISEYIIRHKIKTNKPIAVTFLSDLHLGSPATNYIALKKDLQSIRECDDIKICAGGDWEDSFIPDFKDAGAVANQLSKPQDQFCDSEAIYLEFEDKIIAKISGNHDEMIVKKTGVSPTFFVVRNKKFRYLKDGGLVKLTIGDVTYEILWHHKWRYQSTINLFNSHHRMAEMLCPNCDIVVQEHEHNPGSETLSRWEYDAKKKVINIRTGTYKEGDTFSRKFYKEGVIGPATVVLFPDRRKIESFVDVDAIRDAQAYMRGL
jgi:hypothetical protein